MKNGKVKIDIEGKSGAGQGCLALRIPGYVKEFWICRNQKKLEQVKVEKGYALLEELGEKEEITISFPMKARFVWANPNVCADEGKVAVMRGPLVYCLEEVDNGKNLSACYIDTREEPEEIFEQELLGGVVSIRLKGKRISPRSWEDMELYGEHRTQLEKTEFKAVPYCNWGNRKTGEMAVWIKEIL